MTQELDPRITQIWMLAAALKHEKMPVRDRRETVVACVAESDIIQETTAVQEIAIAKYFRTSMPSVEMPVILISPHGHNPRPMEIVNHLKRIPESVFPASVSTRELKIVVDEWMQIRMHRERWETVTPLLGRYMPFLKTVGLAFDEYTNDFVQSTSDQTQAGLIMARKGRSFADANRPSFLQKSAFVKVEGDEAVTEIPHIEYPTSIRAAQYWALRQMVEQCVGLDEGGKALSPILVLLIHGIADRVDADVIIGGGGRSKKLGDVIVANPSVLQWVGERLHENLGRLDLNFTVGENKVSRKPKVVIHRYGIGRNKALCKVEDDWKLIEREGTMFAAATVGLDHFRSGAIIRVNKLGEIVQNDDFQDAREFIIPGMGDNLHLVQVELGAVLRMDVQNRHVVIEALASLSSDFMSENAKRRWGKTEVDSSFIRLGKF